MPLGPKAFVDDGNTFWRLADVPTITHGPKAGGQHTVSEGIWQTPDTVQTLLVYPKQVQAHFEGTFSNAYGAAHIVFMGTDASLYIDRGRYEVHPERGRGKYEELVLGTGPKGRDFYDKPDGERLHLEDWIEAIRAGKRTQETVP